MTTTSSRIFYCPTHGRVTEEDFESAYYRRDDEGLAACAMCAQWYHRLPKYSAKRAGES